MRQKKNTVFLDLPENTLETKETEGDEGGNTGSPSKAKSLSRDLQYKYWSFTWNNFEMETVETVETILRGECIWYIFQEEVGESGTPHLQGTLYLKDKQRLGQLKCWCRQIHWEATRSVKASIAYCLKEDTRTGKQWCFGIDIPKEIKVHEPRGWHMEVMDILKNDPDERSIH